MVSVRFWAPRAYDLLYRQDPKTTSSCFGTPTSSKSWAWCPCSEEDEILPGAHKISDKRRSCLLGESGAIHAGYTASKRSREFNHDLGVYTAVRVGGVQGVAGCDWPAMSAEKHRPSAERHEFPAFRQKHGEFHQKRGFPSLCCLEHCKGARL